MKHLSTVALLITLVFTVTSFCQDSRWENGQWCSGSQGIPGISSANLSCISAAQVSAMEARDATAALKQIRELQINLLAAINGQLAKNTQAMQDLQAEIKRQNETYNIELQKLIIGRFQNLPAELLNNETFSKEIKELMKKILEDVGRTNVSNQTSSPRSN